MTWRAWATFATLCAIWGLPYFFIKLALQDLSPVCVAWGRITLATIVLVPIAWHRGALQKAFAHKAAVTAFAVAELVIPFSLIAMGEQWISSSLTPGSARSNSASTSGASSRFRLPNAWHEDRDRNQ